MSDKKSVPKKRNALGRGLGALLEDSGSKKETNEERRANMGGMDEIRLNEIEVNPFQPRTFFDKESLQELAESIKVQGIIQPVTVRRLERNRYQLISGERRFQASKLAGLDSIPAYIRTADDQQMLEMALIENIQRKDLNAIEIALSYQRLLSECDLKQEQLGERVGKNRTTVNNYLRLLKLPPDIQIALRDNKISMGHARAIINVENVDAQLAIFNKVISDDLSVRKVEALVRDLMTKGEGEEDEDTKKHKKSAANDYEIKRLQQKLSSYFGTKINIKSDDKNKGEIKIPFVSAEDLNRILEILNV